MHIPATSSEWAWSVLLRRAQGKVYHSVGAMLGLARRHRDGLLPTDCSVAYIKHKTTPSLYCYHICIFLRILLHMPVLAEILRTVTKVPVLLLWTAWLKSSGHWFAQTQGCFGGFSLIPSHLLQGTGQCCGFK